MSDKYYRIPWWPCIHQISHLSEPTDPCPALYCHSAIETSLYTHTLCMCQTGHKTLLIHSLTLSNGFMLCGRQMGFGVLLNLSLAMCLFNMHDGAFICTYSLLNVKCLTKRHYGEVFATELAGNGDFLPQGPASLGNHMMGSCRGVMTHLKRMTGI